MCATSALCMQRLFCFLNYCFASSAFRRPTQRRTNTAAFSRRQSDPQGKSFMRRIENASTAQRSITQRSANNTPGSTTPTPPSLPFYRKTERTTITIHTLGICEPNHFEMRVVFVFVFARREAEVHVRVCVVSVARRGSRVKARSKTVGGFDTSI